MSKIHEIPFKACGNVELQYTNGGLFELFRGRLERFKDVSTVYWGRMFELKVSTLTSHSLISNPQLHIPSALQTALNMYLQ